MNKFEAKKLLTELDSIQEFFNNKNLPQLNRKLITEVAILKKNSFEDWSGSLPESVKGILYNKLTSDQIYATFFPSLFHNTLSKNEIILVFSILKSRSEIENCEKENSKKLNDLRLILQFIIENDKSALFSIFQSSELKENLRKAKYFAEENKNLISNILDKQKNEWDEIADSFDGLESSLQNEQLEYLKPFINEDTEKTKEDKIFKNIREFIENSTHQLSMQSRNSIEENVRNIWKQLKEEELDQQLNSFSIEMLKNQIKDEQIRDAVNNFDNIKQIISLSVTELSERYDLDPQKSGDLIKEAKNLLEKIESNIYPKLTLDSLRGSRLRLLHLLNAYKNYPADQAAEEKVVLENYNKLEEKLNNLEEVAPNRYLTNSINQETFKYWCESEAEIYRILDGCIQVNRTFKRHLHDDLSDQEIKTLFEKDSPTFYALIEEITGNKKSYNPSDLPDYIVQEVRKTKLDLKGFKAHLRPYQDFGSKYISYF